MDTLKKLTELNKPTPVVPAGYIKVTNFRRGELLLTCAPHKIPPGTSYHDQRLFDAMPDAVVEYLQAHMRDKELLFESAAALPPPPEPVHVPAQVAPVQTGPVAPVPLSADRDEAKTQIMAQTDSALLNAWFDQLHERNDVELSELVLARAQQLNPV